MAIFCWWVILNVMRPTMRGRNTPKYFGRDEIISHTLPSPSSTLTITTNEARARRSVGFLLEMVGPVLVPGHSFVMIVLLLPFFQSGKSPLALLPGKPFNGPESSSTWSDVVTFIF